MEKRDAGERRGHGAASRIPRTTTGPSDEHAERHREQRQRAFQARQRQQRRQEREAADHQGDRRRAGRLPAKQRGVPPQAAEIEDAERDAGDEMRREAENAAQEGRRIE